MKKTSGQLKVPISDQSKRIPRHKRSTSLPDHVLGNVAGAISQSDVQASISQADSAQSKVTEIEQTCPSSVHGRNVRSISNVVEGFNSGFTSGHRIQYSWDSANGVESATELADFDENTSFEMVSPESKVGRSFAKHFPSLLETPIIHANFSCSLVKDTVPMHGKLFLTPSYACFFSKLFRKQYVIRLSEVHSISKVKSAFVVPNAVKIVTSTQKFTFGSLFHRHTTYKMLFILWVRNSASQRLIEYDRMSLSSASNHVSNGAKISCGGGAESSCTTNHSNLDSSYVDSEELSNNDFGSDESVKCDSAFVPEKDPDLFFNASTDGGEFEGNKVKANRKDSEQQRTYQVSATVRYRPSQQATDGVPKNSIHHTHHDILMPDQTAVAVDSPNISATSGMNCSSSGSKVPMDSNNNNNKSNGFVPEAGKVNNLSNGQWERVSPPTNAGRKPSITASSLEPVRMETVEKHTTVLKRCQNCEGLEGKVVLEPCVFLLMVLLLLLTTVSAYLSWSVHLNQLHHQTGARAGWDKLQWMEGSGLTEDEKVQFVRRHSSCAINRDTMHQFAMLSQANNQILTNIQNSLEVAANAVKNSGPNYDEMLKAVLWMTNHGNSSH